METRGETVPGSEYKINKPGNVKTHGIPLAEERGDREFNERSYIKIRIA